MSVIILHEGVEYVPFHDGWDDREDVSGQPATIDVLAERDRIVQEGLFLLPDRTPMSPLAAKRVRARLLGTYAAAPEVRDGFGRRSEASRRFLIPGLWPWGHIPMLGGPPKAGKTTLIADLAASLLVPGRNFLGHFEAADLRQDEHHVEGLWVWMVNAETPAEDFEAALVAAGIVDDTWLTIDHLEESFGGASAFDLRKPEIYDLWLNRLVWCDPCDGTNDQPPSVVIVDGLTAILAADTTAYGEWYAAFRQLMREVGVPNAIVTAHNGLRGRHLMNGVESMAQADGLWNYFTDDSDAADPARYFQVTPRVGGVPIPKTCVRFEEGRLRMRPKTERKTEAVGERRPSDPDWAAKQILSKLRAAGSEGMMTTALTGRGRVGGELRAALDILRRVGQVVARSDGLGQRWFLAESAPEN